MKWRTCAIGSHFDTFVPLCRERVVTFPPPSPCSLNELFIFLPFRASNVHRCELVLKIAGIMREGGCLERSLLGSLCISWGHAFLHAYTHLGTHARSPNWKSTKTQNRTASGQPEWKAHSVVIATIGSPMCSAVIKGKLKNGGSWWQRWLKSPSGGWGQQDITRGGKDQPVQSRDYLSDRWCHPYLWLEYDDACLNSTDNQHVTSNVQGSSREQAHTDCAQKQMMARAPESC